jgi:hypothetical protein
LYKSQWYVLRGKTRRSTEKPNASNVAGTRNGGRFRRMVLRTMRAIDSGVARDDLITLAMNGAMFT